MELLAVLRGAGVGPKAREAFQLWALSCSRPWAKDWTPHQLALAGGVNPSTVRRSVGKLVASGLVVMLSPHVHSPRGEVVNVAAVYRFTDRVPSFSETRVPTAFSVPHENASCAIPRSLPTGEDREITPPPTIPVPTPQAPPLAPGPLAPEPTPAPSHQALPAAAPLDGDGAALVDALAAVPVDRAGAQWGVARVLPALRAPLVGAIRAAGQELLALARAECLRLPRPGRAPNPEGLLIAWLVRKPGWVVATAQKVVAGREREDAAIRRHAGGVDLQAMGRDGALALARLRQLRENRPAPDSPGMIEHCAAEFSALRSLVDAAASSLGSGADALAAAARAEVASVLPEAHRAFVGAVEAKRRRKILEKYGLEGLC